MEGFFFVCLPNLPSAHVSFLSGSHWWLCLLQTDTQPAAILHNSVFDEEPVEILLALVAVPFMDTKDHDEVPERVFIFIFEKFLLEIVTFCWYVGLRDFVQRLYYFPYQEEAVIQSCALHWHYSGGSEIVRSVLACIRVIPILQILSQKRIDTDIFAYLRSSAPSFIINFLGDSLILC